MIRNAARTTMTMALTVASLAGFALAPCPVAAAAAAAPASEYSSTRWQSIEVSTWAQLPEIHRDSYTVTLPPPPPPPPPLVVIAPVRAARTAVPATPAAPAPDPGSAQAIARDMLAGRGWNENEFSCLVSLWNRESRWNVSAANGSGAYGIPQALPGSKMSSAGADWQTNPATQISWGLGYIGGRYGSPCAAWAHSENSGWY